MDIFISEHEQKIFSFDLNFISKYVQRQEEWTKHDAELMCSQYRNFIYLCKKHSHLKLVPSEEIDIVWHAHILHTQNYIAFCQSVFGRYFHHQPEQIEHASDIASIKKRFVLTQQLYQEEFGTCIFSVKTFVFSAILTKLMLILHKLAFKFSRSERAV